MSPTLTHEFFVAVDHCQAAIWMADLSLRESQAVIYAGLPAEVRAANRWWTQPLHRPGGFTVGDRLRGLRQLIPGHEWYREAFDQDPEVVRVEDPRGAMRRISEPIAWQMGIAPRHILERLAAEYGIEPPAWRPAVPAEHPAPPRSVHERMGPG